MRTQILAVLAILTVPTYVYGDEQNLCVKLTTAGNECLVGQAIAITLTVTNLGTQEVPVWMTELSNQVTLVIASGGASPVRFAARKITGGSICIYPNTEPLPPGASKSYEYRLLYDFVGKDTRERQSRLAFDRPGMYTVKAVYPVPGPGERKLDSNTVEIKIRQPEGVDAEVWREIKHRQFLYFLQHRERLFGELDDTPVRIADILQEYPKSRYCECLRAALREYYEINRKKMTPEQTFGDLEMAKLHKVLGIAERPPMAFDARLAPKVRLEFQEETALEDILADASRQTRVKLTATEEIKDRKIASLKFSGMPLHEFMKIIGNWSNGTWIEQEDGSFLLVSKAKREGAEPSAKAGKVS